MVPIQVQQEESIIEDYRQKLSTQDSILFFDLYCSHANTYFHVVFYKKVLLSIVLDTPLKALQALQALHSQFSTSLL